MVHLDPFVRLRLQRRVEHLHRLGPRVVAEFLAEILTPDEPSPWDRTTEAEASP
jgi:hypothetical protein